MAKLDKPKYLKLFDIQRIIKYIFCSEKRPHYLQLIPKPTKIVLVLLENNNNPDYSNPNIFTLSIQDEYSQKSRQNPAKNNESSINSDDFKSLNFREITKIPSDRSLYIKPSNPHNLKSKPNENSSENLDEISCTTSTSPLEKLGFIKVHINENFNLQDLHKNILKCKNISKIKTVVLTEENLKLIERHDINHLFSYSNFVKSQTELDLSIFESFSRPENISKNFVIFLDCEMMMCKNGKQVGRVTILDHNANVIYDKYIKPESEVVDYLEKYSGLNCENTNNGISYKQMKNDISKIIGKNTTIVGHGVENDLEALQLYSENLIDTAYLFLNSDGHKIKLSQLSKIYFSEAIQSQEHNSVEDALCCLRLLCYKINEILNFHDPHGEYLDINVECEEINNISQIKKDRTIYMIREESFDLSNYPPLKGVFYLFLSSENNNSYLYMKQRT